MSKYAEVLRPFLALMEKELHANSHKGDREGWLQMTEEQALGEIEYHVSKLSKAMNDMSPDGIREFAADTANLCMMLLDIGGQLKDTATTHNPPKPIYDEAKRIAELEQALAGMLFAFDDGVGLDWSEDLLDFARKLTPAVEFQSCAKAGEVGHE